MIAGPNEARLKTCPMTKNGEAATEENFSGSRCQGDGCMAWRWVPFSASDVNYMDACRKAAQRTGEDGKPLGQKWAAAYVNKNRAEFGLPESPELGYCGIAGSIK